MNEHDSDAQFEIFTPQGSAQPETPRRKRLQSSRRECIRCGECCMKGGPILLREDMPLLNSRLSYGDIHTVREGEPRVSRHDQEVYFSSMELVKLREKAGLPHCLFYSGAEGCEIYDQRPVLCRAFKCWATEEMITGIGEKGLNRMDLFGSVEMISEVISRHSEKCGYEGLVQAVTRLREGDEAAAEELIDMLQYDEYIRPFLTERFNLPPASLDLILGRPLAETIEPLGMRVRRDGEECILERIETREEE